MQHYQLECNVYFADSVEEHTSPTPLTREMLIQKLNKFLASIEEDQRIKPASVLATIVFMEK
jgi:hypothetical protein